MESTTKKATTGLTAREIFLTRAEFQHREDYLQLPKATPIPAMQINVTMELMAGNDESAAARIRIENDKAENPLYLFVVEMMVLINRVQGEEAPQTPAKFLAAAGASVLYPFLREAVANLTGRGRFGPVYLNPFSIKAFVEEGFKEAPQPQSP